MCLEYEVRGGEWHQGRRTDAEVCGRSGKPLKALSHMCSSQVGVCGVTWAAGRMV